MGAAPRTLRGTPVCVLGMHRSGSSLVAGILHILGVHFGSGAVLMEGKPQNPRGFFEHRQLSKFSEHLLRRLGGSWDRPPVLSPGWEQSPALADLREGTREIIERDLARDGVWGWKDPRVSLTAPFWEDLVPSPRFVMCVRDPVEVAASLARRDRMPFETSIDLWVTYTAAAVRHTAGRPRIVLFYDDVLEDWGAEVERLAKFVGVRPVARDPERRDAVAGFVDADLRHHRAAPPALAARVGLPARALYLALRMYAHREGIPQLEAALDDMALEAEGAGGADGWRALRARLADARRKVKPRVGRIAGKVLRRW